VCKNGSRNECLFEGVKSVIIEGIKLLGNVFMDKICQWNDNVQVVKDELTIKVSET